MVEILVSLTIFSLVIGVVSAGFVTISRAYQYGYLVVNAQKNLRFVLESMTREIKEGSQYYSFEGAVGFSFLDKDGNTVEYYVDADQNFIRQQGEEELPVIAQDLRVAEAMIETRCTVAESLCQPQVTFVLTIEPRVSQVQFKTVLQTTIVQRLVGVY